MQQSTATTAPRPILRQPTRSRPGRLRELIEPLLYLSPSLVILVWFVFYPLLRSVYLSLFLTDPFGRPKLFAGLQNFIDALTTPEFLHSLWTSVLYVLLTVPTGVVLGLLLALLANQKLKGVKLFHLIFSSPLCISVATGASIFMMLYNPITGLLNYILSLFGVAGVGWLTDPKWALVSIALTSIWMRLGFNFVLMIGGLKSVPAELYEAAHVDGAGPLSRLRHITLPMLSPTLFFATVVGMIHGFQAFGEVDIMTSGGPMDATNVIVNQIYQQAFRKSEFGGASAQALILFAVILVLTFLQFRLGERRVHYQ